MASGAVCKVLRYHSVNAAAGTLPRVSQPVMDQSILSFFLCSGRVDSEPQQNRSHQRAATYSGHANDKTDHQACDDEPCIAKIHCDTQHLRDSGKKTGPQHSEVLINHLYRNDLSL
jgi:hypothetical protein